MVHIMNGYILGVKKDVKKQEIFGNMQRAESWHIKRRIRVKKNRCEQMTIRLPEELKDKLQLKAAMKGISANEMVVISLQKYLKEQ